MRTYLLLSICLLLCARCSQCSAEEYENAAKTSSLPNTLFAGQETTHIQYYKKGDSGLRAKAVITMDEKNSPICTLSSHGEGSYHPYENAYWEAKSTFEIKGARFIGITGTGAIFDGKTRQALARSEKLFDHEKKILSVTHYDSSNIVKRKKIFPLRYPTVDSAMLPFFLQKHIATGAAQKSVSFYVITEAMNLYHAKTRYAGQEMIQTPTGEKNAYKIKIIADFGPLSWIGNFFAPPTYIWYAVESPHAWLKFEGLEVDVESPHITGYAELQRTSGKKNIK
jgi:hypothetical protein